MTELRNILGTDGIPRHRIIRRSGKGLLEEDVHVGDFVELFVDGTFFHRKDGKHERYAGFVKLIDQHTIVLSPSSLENKRHGYLGTDEAERKQVGVPVECMLVKGYRIYG